MTSPANTSFMVPSNILDNEMNVTKRNGQLETVSFDKILQRMKRIGTETGIKVNYTSLAMKVIDQLYDGISATKIDELCAEQCASMASIHYDYNTLAGRIVVSNHHKNTSNSFSEVMRKLHGYLDKHCKHAPLVSDQLIDVINKHGDMLDELCDYKRDYFIDYFGFKTLDRAYLMKIDGKSVERPQHMWMRVAVGIHGFELDSIIETYDLMSQKYFTHATPTLFNAGTPRPQLSSCFLIAMESDSIDGIYNTLKDCALISKMAGGIGLHIHNVRATGSHIRGTNGTSNGIVPMLKVFNNTAKYVDQCVHPETIIYTTDGPKQIQQCTSGETAVINATGKSEVIHNILEHYYEGEIIEIQTEFSYSNKLRITSQHPIYVLRDDIPQWMSVEDVLLTDKIMYSIPTYENDIFSISQDDCRIYGYIMKYGCIENGYYTIPITRLDCEDDVSKIDVDFIKAYLEANLVEYTIINNQMLKDDEIVWKPALQLPFRYSDFYNDANQKRIHSRWLHLSLDKIKALYSVFEDCEYTMELESQINYLLLRLSIHETPCGLSKYDTIYITPFHIEDSQSNRSNPFISSPEGGILNENWSNNKVLESVDEGFIYTNIVNITKRHYNGILYDLQMKEQHDYLLENGLVHNGGGKRNGSFAIYLEPWHADIEMFLQMRKNHGDEELKARDLFYAIWMPDLFMERVKANGKWTLMCPDECPGLADVYGDDFRVMYEMYETENKGRESVNARDLWFKILDAQMETGMPYIVYKDACNKKSNQKNIGTIKSSNLCVAPETQILTDKGHIEIQSLENKTVNVWNGEEFSEVTVRKTGEDQELIEIHIDDGLSLTCTKYHKFYIQERYSKNSIKQVEAKDLQIGNKLIKCEYPIIDGKETMLYPYTHGFFCGNGTYGNVNSIEDHVKCEFTPLCGLNSSTKLPVTDLNQGPQGGADSNIHLYKSMEEHHHCKRHIDFETNHNTEKLYEDQDYCNAICYTNKPRAYLYGEKKELLQYIEYRSKADDNGCISLELPLDIADKFFVPLNHSLEDKMKWFAGYCDADGTISKNGTNESLQISSINVEFLLKIKLMLQTCGINPKVRKMRDFSHNLLPDGKGEQKYYDTKPVYRLLISSCDLCTLVDNGFSPKRLIINKNKPKRSSNKFLKINNIIDNGRRDDTFCFTEPKRNMGIFNGIITGQCSEVVQYSDDTETAVCNLASIGLPSFVLNQKIFDYDKLHEVAKVVTKNLNKIIDVNYYPTEKTRKSNMRHRPIGIGVQGLADVFMLMNIPFLSDEAKEINRNIFETIYHAALESSCEIAEVEGAYETFFEKDGMKGSPASKGILQFDMWELDPGSNRYDWNALKEQIKCFGLRNSLLLAPMPTASTSQILGFNECIEPITSNIYSRRTLAGEFIQANKYLMADLINAGLWNEKIKNNMIANNGSIQHIDVIPQEIKDKYKTVWELPMRGLIDMAADRGAFICQSQSLNLWLEDPNYSTLTAMHFYSWQKGLKTGIYYLRRRGKHQAQQFTIEPEKAGHTNNEEQDEICEMCSA